MRLLKDVQQIRKFKTMQKHLHNTLMTENVLFVIDDFMTQKHFHKQSIKHKKTTKISNNSLTLMAKVKYDGKSQQIEN